MSGISGAGSSTTVPGTTSAEEKRRVSFQSLEARAASTGHGGVVHSPTDTFEGRLSDLEQSPRVAELLRALGR